MKTEVKPELKYKMLCIRKSYNLPREKKFIFIDLKFYQKLLILLISLSTILIFPESPSELEDICENYNSSELCIVW